MNPDRINLFTYYDYMEKALDHLRYAEENHPTIPDDIVYCANIITEESGELAREVNGLVHECESPNSALSRLRCVETEAYQTIVTCLRLIHKLGYFQDQYAKGVEM